MQRPKSRDSSPPTDTDSQRRLPMTGSSRGQTPLDFALGASLFLLALAFLFMTLPGIVAPFDSPAESKGETLRSERATAQLIHSLTADNRYVGQPTSIDRHCTKAFFDQTGITDASVCPFSHADPIKDRLGLRTVDDVHITVKDTTGSTVSLDGTELALGDEPSSSDRTTATTRVIYLDGEPHFLTVTLW